MCAFWASISVLIVSPITLRCLLYIVKYGVTLAGPFVVLKANSTSGRSTN